MLPSKDISGMRPKRKTKRRPTAKTKVKKVDLDVLSSQFSQSQQSYSQHIKTPVRKNRALNSLVLPNSTIFSPRKDEEYSQENAYDSGSGRETEEKQEKVDGTDEEVIEVESGSSSEESSDGLPHKRHTESSKDGFKKPKGLTSYTAPLNTKNWQPLPPQVHSELSTLLNLLIPTSVDDKEEYYAKALESEIIRPLIAKFASVYLPPIQNKSYRQLSNQRSNEFNLNMLDQEQARLTSSYDINSKQLDMLALQLVKEKEMIAIERGYLKKLKENINTWKTSKNRRLDRLKSELGEKFTNICNSLNAADSGFVGADDIDMVQDTKADTNLDDPDLNKRLLKLNKYLTNLETHVSPTKDFQESLKQLSNKLQKKNTNS